MGLKAERNSMRISPARIYRRLPCRNPARLAAITLIELLLVIALFTLTVSLVAPSFYGMLEGEREREMKRMVRVMRVARNEAVLTGHRHRIWFDLREHLYEFEKEVDGVFEPYQRPRMMRPHRLPESLRMVDLMVLGEGSERIRDTRVSILIDNSGFMDPFMLHVRYGKEIFTMRANGLSGIFEVLPGDVTELRR